MHKVAIINLKLRTLTALSASQYLASSANTCSRKIVLVLEMGHPKIYKLETQANSSSQESSSVILLAGPLLLCMQSRLNRRDVCSPRALLHVAELKGSLPMVAPQTSHE